jgi:VCBS repeat-containing protein
MQVKFKEDYKTQLVDEDGSYAYDVNWKQGDTEECTIGEKFVSGTTLEFPDGTSAENVPNRVFEIVKR